MRKELEGRILRALCSLGTGLILLSVGAHTGCSVEGDAAYAQGSREEPVAGGVLRMALEAPRSLDPAVVDTVYGSVAVNQIFDPLVSLDQSLHVVPGLASTWTISRDGRTYTFHLRPDVRFHDGAPLTADDVVFTFERALSPRNEIRGLVFPYLSVVEGAAEFAAGDRTDLPGVVALDSRTVQIRLIRPYFSFLEVLAMDGLLVVPRHIVTAVGDDEFARAPVGSGPFRFASWTEDHLILEANPDHFAGRPYLDAVRIQFLGDDEDDQGAARFYRNELDVVDVVSEHAQRLSSSPGVRIHRYQELSLAFVGLLTGVPPLDQPEVRQAVALALDREAIVRQSPDQRRMAVGLLPPGMPAYSPKMKCLPHDPERARQLLAESGHPGGRGLEPIRMHTTAKSAAAKRLFEQMRKDLEAVGLRLELVDVSWADFSVQIANHEAPAFLMAWIADLPDPDAFLRTLFEPGGAANFSDFHDDAIGELIDKGAREMNPVERAKIYREAEREILELAPMIPLYHSLGRLAMRSAVRGLEPGPLGLANVKLERVWFSRPESAR